MIETMRAAEGVGLGAPQVGFGIQLFVYEAADEDDPRGGVPLHVVINPMVEPLPGELVYDWEGCLSIPDLRGLVPRHLVAGGPRAAVARAARDQCEHQTEDERQQTEPGGHARQGRQRSWARPRRRDERKDPPAPQPSQARVGPLQAGRSRPSLSARPRRG